jgi:chromatin remodeling complex protein RSC6
MAPKRTSKSTSSAQKSASVSSVTDDVQPMTEQESVATQPVADDVVEQVVENVDNSTETVTSPVVETNEINTEIVGTDVTEDSEDAGTTTETKKGLSPIECLKEDLENMLEGATNLVAFSKDLESRLRKNLKTIYKIARKRTNVNSVTKDSPKRETNLTKQIKISEDMAYFAKIEGDEASRTIIVKTISDYSKQNGLKLESDKRVIVLDEVLAKLMKKDVGDNVRFCDVQKFIKHHFV